MNSARCARATSGAPTPPITAVAADAFNSARREKPIFVSLRYSCRWYHRYPKCRVISDAGLMPAFGGNTKPATISFSTSRVRTSSGVLVRPRHVHQRRTQRDRDREDGRGTAPGCCPDCGLIRAPLARSKASGVALSSGHHFNPGTSGSNLNPLKSRIYKIFHNIPYANR